MRCRVCRPGDRTVSLSQTHHEIAGVQRIRRERSRLVSHYTFRTAQVVKHRDHLFEISSAAMIDDRNATEVQSILVRRSAYLFLIAQYRDARYALIDAMSRGHHRARIVSLWKNDVLWSGHGALGNVGGDVHA